MLFCFSVKTTRLRPPLFYGFPTFKIDLLFYTPEVSRGRGGVRSSLTEVDLGSQSGYPPRPPAGVGPIPRGALSGADPYESAESRRRHLWPGGGPTALIPPPAPAMPQACVGPKSSKVGDTDPLNTVRLHEVEFGIDTGNSRGVDGPLSMVHLRPSTFER